MTFPKSGRLDSVWFFGKFMIMLHENITKDWYIFFFLACLIVAKIDLRSWIARHHIILKNWVLNLLIFFFYANSNDDPFLWTFLANVWLSKVLRFFEYNGTMPRSYYIWFWRLIIVNECPFVLFVCLDFSTM